MKSQSTYEKSRLATQVLLGTPEGSNIEKIDDVANYLLNRCEDITPLALQKLLYYVQGFYYAFANKFIFEENCEAWVHGPVFREIYFKYREYRFDPISDCDDITDLNLNVNVSEKAIIDSIIKNLNCYSGKILESFTVSAKSSAPFLALTCSPAD